MWIFFFRKTILSHISRFMLFSTFKKKNIKKYPFTYWLNGRWFLQLVEKDSWNLYPLYPLFPCSDFVSQMWGWFGGWGGGVMFFSHFMLFPTFLEKKIWEYKPIISHLMFLRVFISRGAEGPGREILQRPPSVHPSVCPSRLVFAL